MNSFWSSRTDSRRRNDLRFDSVGLDPSSSPPPGLRDLVGVAMQSSRDGEGCNRFACEPVTSVGDIGCVATGESYEGEVGDNGSSVEGETGLLALRFSLLFSLNANICESVMDRRLLMVGDVARAGLAGTSSWYEWRAGTVSAACGASFMRGLGSLTVARREPLPTFLIERRACVARARNVLDFLSFSVRSPTSAMPSLRRTLTTSTISSSSYVRFRVPPLPLLRMSVWPSSISRSMSCRRGRVPAPRWGIMIVS